MFHVALPIFTEILHSFYHFKAMSGREIWDNEWFYGLNGLVLGVQLS